MALCGIRAALFFLLLGFCLAEVLEFASLSGRNNKLKGRKLKEFVEYLNQGKLHISFGAVQTPGTHGTFLRVTVRRKLLFDLQGNSNEQQLILKYAGFDTERIVKIPFDTSSRVHNYTVSIETGSLRLLADCQDLLHPENAPIAVPHNISFSGVKVFIGQRHRHTSYFLGEFTHFHFANQSSPTLCAQNRNARAHISAPARDEDASFCPECVDFLKHRILRLEDKVRRLEENAVKLGHHVSNVIRHQRGCYSDGRYYDEGQQWQMGNCTICSCVGGREKCHREGCPKLSCLKPVLLPASCCPVCLKSCTYNAQVFEHGEKLYPKVCVEVTCNNGSEKIRVMNRKSYPCPLLPCPNSYHVSVPDKCCPVCQDFDFCGNGHKCGKNAYCENLKYEPVCYCNPGFTGDPDSECVDEDECSLEEEIIDEIGCGAGTFCVNTPGSFECHCRPGFQRFDQRSCIDSVSIY